jgi:hypothetical protein
MKEGNEETEEASAGSEKKTGIGKLKERKDSVNDSSVSVFSSGPSHSGKVPRPPWLLEIYDKVTETQTQTQWK